MRRAVIYRVHKARPGTLCLWTIQPRFVWERLRNEGQLSVDLSQHPDPSALLHRLDAYDWMRGQMARRLHGYQGRFPWWGYFGKKPDLRRFAWREGMAGETRVRLELALEPERVLPSVLPAWEALFDRQYVGKDGADYEAWSEEIERAGVDESQWPLPEPWHSRVTASWEQIFDVEALVTSGAWYDLIQATFEHLNLVDVVTVTEFPCRGPRSNTVVLDIPGTVRPGGVDLYRVAVPVGWSGSVHLQLRHSDPGAPSDRVQLEIYDARGCPVPPERMSAPSRDEIPTADRIFNLKVRNRSDQPLCYVLWVWPGGAVLDAPEGGAADWHSILSGDPPQLS